MAFPMRKNSLIALLVISAFVVLSGCNQDPTVKVDAYVYDDSGNRVEGATVNAYSQYSLGTGAADKWLGINGRLEASAKTNKDGYTSVQIFPGQYAFAATKGEATGGEEKLVIAGQNSVSIRLEKPKLKEFDSKVSLYDESGNLVDVTKLKVHYVSTICKINSDESCSGQRLDPVNANPITGKVKDGYSYSVVFQVNCDPQTLKCSGEYDEASLNFNVNGAGNYDFSITLKKKPRKFNLHIDVVDESGGIIDLKSDKVLYMMTLCGELKEKPGEECQGPSTSNELTDNPIEVRGAELANYVKYLKFTLEFYSDRYAKTTIIITVDKEGDYAFKVVMKKKSVVTKSSSASRYAASSLGESISGALAFFVPPRTDYPVKIKVTKLNGEPAAGARVTIILPSGEIFKKNLITDKAGEVKAILFIGDVGSEYTFGAELYEGEVGVGKGGILEEPPQYPKMVGYISQILQPDKDFADRQEIRQTMRIIVREAQTPHVLWKFKLVDESGKLIDVQGSNATFEWGYSSSAIGFFPGQNSAPVTENPFSFNQNVKANYLEFKAAGYKPSQVDVGSSRKRLYGDNLFGFDPKQKAYEITVVMKEASARPSPSPNP